MQQGRPKKPTALKKLQGTYRKDRDSKKADVQIATTDLIIKDEKEFKMPATIKNAEVKKFWNSLVHGLCCIGVLSGADLPQIEQLCLCLQKMKKLQKAFMDVDVDDENFTKIVNAYTRLMSKFDELAAKYYISPVARSHIRLEELSIKEKELTVEAKTRDAVSNLLSARIKNG